MNKTTKADAAKADATPPQGDTQTPAAAQDLPADIERSDSAVAQPLARLGEHARVRSAGLMVDAQGLPYSAEIQGKGIELVVDAYVLRCLSRGDMSLA